MGHFEDKLWFIMEEVNRLGVQKEFDKITDRLREENPYMETRDLFEMGLNEIKGRSTDNTNE